MSSTVRRRGTHVPASVTSSNTKAVDAIASEARHGRILAVDYGRKRIGLAISDELKIIARPLETLQRENRRKDLHRLRKICREQGVARIIVGYPLHISGEAGEMAAEAEAFAKRLASAVGLTVELVDERLTSWEARQTMAHTKAAQRQKREPLDDIAAAVLLRGYLEQKLSRAHSKLAETDSE